MAAPEGFTPVYDNVIVFVYSGRGFGIRPVGANAAVGTIYKIGANAYRVSVGQKVGFKTDVYFATELGNETYAIIPQDNVMVTYNPIP